MRWTYGPTLCSDLNRMNSSATATLHPDASTSATAFNRVSIVVKGGWLKTAMIRDEELVEGETVGDPASFLAALEKNGPKADIFAFSQKPPQRDPIHPYYHNFDNLAVIPITTFKAWLESLSQDTRRNVRRAAKRGITVNAIEFSDELARGIKEIYDETPHRQGRHFWHYGKDFSVVKAEAATYLERSQFIGAYNGSELIGFAKMVFVDNTARILHILSKTKHQDKRPTNALIAKAVEICEEKKIPQLIYCKYSYGKGDDDSLTTFKRHSGFERVDFPRYYVPLTTKGRLAIKLGLHLGFKELVPRNVLALLRKIRAKYYEGSNRPPTNQEATAN